MLDRWQPHFQQRGATLSLQVTRYAAIHCSHVLHHSIVALGVSRRRTCKDHGPLMQPACDWKKVSSKMEKLRVVCVEFHSSRFSGSTFVKSSLYC